MKSLKIKYLAQLDNIEIKDAAVFFKNNESFHRIDMVNWSNLFPHKPDCRFKIARSKDSLFIYYKNTESSVRALFKNDNDNVWEDSCVEFFCQRPAQKSYFNFETNCIGTCLASEREGREENVQPFSRDKLSEVKRHASLGTKAFEENNTTTDWELTIQIPFHLIGVDANNLPEKLKANFYKCGDGTSNPHYLSWNKIDIQEPDFHRPDFFGELVF